MDGKYADREKALNVHYPRNMSAALHEAFRAGWDARPGGAPVAPTREALARMLSIIDKQGGHATLDWDDAGYAEAWRVEHLRIADVLLASGLLGERREDVQAEALEDVLASIKEGAWPGGLPDVRGIVQMIESKSAKLRKGTS